MVEFTVRHFTNGAITHSLTHTPYLGVEARERGIWARIPNGEQLPPVNDRQCRHDGTLTGLNKSGERVQLTSSV